MTLKRDLIYMPRIKAREMKSLKKRERVKLNIFQDFLKKIEINRQKYGKV